MKQLSLLVFAALAVSACATVAPSAPSAPSGPPTIPSTPLDLGDWRRASVSGIVGEFERTVSARYGEGVALSAVAADLRRNEFNCSDGGGGRGDPPDQVCRRTETASGCTHTWQVHLFDANDSRLARTRALYDRRCGDDGLLGGPG
ncbi:MAG: hypothetical protein AB7P07_08760 [Hyphomonadaceae bacterium]